MTSSGFYIFSGLSGADFPSYSFHLVEMGSQYWIFNMTFQIAINRNCMHVSIFKRKKSAIALVSFFKFPNQHTHLMERNESILYHLNIKLALMLKNVFNFILSCPKRNLPSCCWSFCQTLKWNKYRYENAPGWYQH